MAGVLENDPLNIKAEGLVHVGYELERCCEASTFLRRGNYSPPDLRNMLLESQLLHARSVRDFLVGAKPYPDDIHRTNFAPDWKPGPLPSVYRLSKTADQKLINKHLAHISWERVGYDQQGWLYSLIAFDLLAVAYAWSEHLRRHDPDLDRIWQLNLDASRRYLVPH